MTLTSAVVLLFLVIDPFGNIPFFVAALNQVDPERHRRVVIRELLIALLVMVAFLFLGQQMLRALGISDPALTIAGGVILFLIAVRMMFPPARSLQEDIDDGEPFIVPLAIPYVAGPSVLAAELLLISKEPDRWPTWLAAVLIAWLVIAIIVLLGSQFVAKLGKRGLIAIERLMGMVLVAIAIQMFLTGVEDFFA